MAEARPASGAILICGMIAASEHLFARAAEALGEQLGPVRRVSDVMPFDLTDYYRQQMGQPLWRQFLAFAPPAERSSLAEVKLATNELEARFAAECPAGPPRPINLDPGYLTEAKLVLASCKDFAHRMYLRDGVYAEVTLLWQAGRWASLP